MGYLEKIKARQKTGYSKMFLAMIDTTQVESSKRVRVFILCFFDLLRRKTFSSRLIFDKGSCDPKIYLCALRKS
jgi:hypothetical protein